MRWVTEIAIEDGAELYLDDLSVSYLNTAGVLDKIAAAGLKVFVSQHQVDEANALIGLESQATAIEAVIERLRAPLAAGIASGTVQLAASRSDAPTSEPQYLMRTSYAAFCLKK